MGGLCGINLFHHTARIKIIMIQTSNNNNWKVVDVHLHVGYASAKEHLFWFFSIM